MSYQKIVRTRPRVKLENDVYTEALKRTRIAFDRFDSIVVAFSGGKDSTIVLELALEVAKERGQKQIDVIHYDEEAIPYETERYVLRRANDPRINMQWLCVPIRHYNACSSKQPWWSPWDPNEKEKWVRELPNHSSVTTDLPGFTAEQLGKLKVEDRPTMPEANKWLYPIEKYGNVGVLMGIRADESMIRYRAVLQRKTDNFIINNMSYEHGGGAGNVSKVYPIYDMTDQDLWTIVRDKQWDYNEAYDLMEAAGVSRSSQRIAPPYGNEPMQNLWTFAVAFPESWDKVSRRVKGAATAARYSRTDLYGFKGISKEPGVTWQDAIAQAIQKHDEPMRSKTAIQIQKWIKLHYSKTNEPILEYAGHPDTGVCWRWLYMIAVRTDAKGRKQPDLKEETAATREKYDKELKHLKETGRIKGHTIMPETTSDEGGTR